MKKEYKFPKLKIKITFAFISFYSNRNWFFFFRSSKLVKSYELRIFGAIVRISEINSLEKLIKLFHESARVKNEKRIQNKNMTDNKF